MNRLEAAVDHENAEWHCPERGELIQQLLPKIAQVVATLEKLKAKPPHADTTIRVIDYNIGVQLYDDSLVFRKPTRPEMPWITVWKSTPAESLKDYPYSELLKLNHYLDYSLGPTDSE